MAEVNLDSLKPNSHKYKEEQEAKEKTRKKLSPIVKDGGLVSAKESTVKKFVKNFVQEDARNVKDYVIFDILLPGLQNAVLDTLSMMFFHEVRGARDRRGGRTDYRASYDGGRGRRDERRDLRDDRREDEPVDYRNIVLTYRADADNVVKELKDRIYEDGDASIAQLFELVGIPSDYTDNDYGWTNESDISVRRVYNGFLIDVRQAKYLGRRR